MDLRQARTRWVAVRHVKQESAPVFFQCTDDAAGRITELFDFVWPAVNAVVLARSRAERHSGLSGAQRREKLKTLFQGPRVLRRPYREIPQLNRANIGKALIETQWGDQEQMFARLVLVNTFAIYEGWLEDLAEELKPAQNDEPWRRKFVGGAQFLYPTRKRPETWAWAVAEMQNSRSVDLEVCFGKKLRGGQLYSLVHTNAPRWKGNT